MQSVTTFQHTGRTCLELVSDKDHEGEVCGSRLGGEFTSLQRFSRVSWPQSMSISPLKCLSELLAGEYENLLVSEGLTLSGFH